MKDYIKNFNLILIFLFLLSLSYFQAKNQSFGYVIDQDWTIIYNSLLIISNFEQEYIDHPAYTTFAIYGLILKTLNLFFNNLNLDILNILDNSDPGNNLQKIFTLIRIFNSVIIFLIFWTIYKTLKLFNLKEIYNQLILLTFLFFESNYQLLFLLRSEALSVLFFLFSNFYFIKYLKGEFMKKNILLGSIFFALSILAKTQVILLFFGMPFIYIFLNEKFFKNNGLIIKNTFFDKVIFIFGSLAILVSILLYFKYPAPTDLVFFSLYLFVYLFFYSFFNKINFTNIKKIINFIYLFIFGIFITFFIIIVLDITKIIQFDYSIIPNNFARPITHMSSFTGYNITDNNFVNILERVQKNIFNLNFIIILLMKNIFIIFFIPFIFLYISKIRNKLNIFYTIFIFLNFLFISIIFLVFRSQPFYQIYLIPLTLFLLLELAFMDRKKIFILFIFLFTLTNFNAVYQTISIGFKPDRTVINLCGYSKPNWNMVNRNLGNYDKFQSLFCKFK